MRHTLRYYSRCFCLRSNKSLKQIKDGKRDVYFDLASRKLDKDLDVITLLRIMQTADQAQKIIFDQKARQLLQFQRGQVVTATSSADSGLDDQFNEDMNMHRTFEEQNVHQREAFRVKLKNLLQQYEDLGKQGQNLKPLELRLLQGIKAKYLVRFEQRKSMLQAKKDKKAFGKQMNREMQKLKLKSARNKAKSDYETQTENKKEKKSWKEMMTSN